MPYAIRPVRHSCGQNLTHVEYIELYDVTSLEDVPEHSKSISFSDLPYIYHRFIPGSPQVHYKAGNARVEECPRCHKLLNKDDMHERVWQETTYQTLVDAFRHTRMCEVQITDSASVPAYISAINDEQHVTLEALLPPHQKWTITVDESQFSKIHIP